MHCKEGERMACNLSQPSTRWYVEVIAKAKFGFASVVMQCEMPQF